ncbi:VCBS domain-containing protein, partial [Shewanella marisflavi]|uniref:VCBS domain-containing protein n=1 Tax=Shewanella marisflavi TaxID=260364 RepID=UPI003AAD23E7
SYSETFNVTSIDGTPSTVTVTINGTNDVPVIAGDDSGAVTEDASNPTLTDTGTLTIDDADADESVFQPGNGVPSQGALGSLTIDANGNWTYNVANADVQYLGEGETKVETFVVLSADGTEHTITITIYGTDDVPTLVADTGSVTEDTNVTVDGNLTTSGTLEAGTGGDAGEDKFTASSQSGQYGTLTLDADGNWVYTADNSQSAIQQLNQDQTLTDTFTVLNADGVTSTTVTITIYGTDDVPTLVADTGSVTEDTNVTVEGNLTTSGTLAAGTGGDAGENKFTADTLNGQYGTLTLDADGNWVYTADNSQSEIQNLNSGESLTEEFKVYNADGVTWTTVTITIHGTDEVTGGNNVDLTVDDANTQGTATDSDSSALSFTAGAYDVTGFAFGNIGDINISGLDASISWSLDGAGNLIGSIGGNPVLQLSLSGGTISAGSTGSVTVTVTLLDNLPHGTNVDELIINGITVVATDASNATATGSVSVKVIDDGVTLDPLDLAGKNAEGIYNGVINVDGADQDFSADLSGNISGTGTFSDSGITAGGLTVFYYVDPANPGILIAYSDTSGTPSAYDSGNSAQSVIFTLAIDPNSDSYQLDLKQAIDELSSVTVANMSGGKGGNTPAVYVTFDGTNYIIDNNINDVDPSNAMVFTLTSTSGNISSTVNGNTNGFGVANAFVDQGEVMIIDYANNVASASIAFDGATYVHFKAYDANGNLLGEGDVTNGQTIGNLGEISYIEVSTSALDNHANFQFTGTSAENIVSSTVDVDLDFVVDVTDGDGDTSTGSIHVDLDAPGSTTTAPTALTSNAISLLSEADLYKDGAESDIQTLRFKSGSESISAFQFGDTDSIQVSGVNAKISWSFNDEGQLIGTFMGKEAIRLTLNGDRIESGEEGSVSVTAEIIDTFPHNVSTENLTISGIDIIAVDANGKTAASTYSVTVQDDAPEIAAGQTVDVTGDNIPNTLVGKYSLSGGYGASNSLDFDGFTITARGFSSATNSELTAADVFSSSDGIGVQSVESPYHNIRSEVDFRKFADGSEGSEEIVVTLDANTLAYGVNIEFSAMFGGELEVGIVEFYRDGKLVTTQAFSSDAKDGNYAAIFEVLEGGFDQMVIRATDNGFGAAHGDNSDFSIKAIDFIGYNDIATGYATGMLSTDWGADGMGSLSLTGTDETGLLTTDGQSISTTLSGNTLIGETESGELVFKVEFTPSTGQWEFYQYQAIEQTHDGQLDFNVIATDSDGDTAVGHFAVNPQSVVRDYQYSSGTDGDNRLSGSDDHDVIVSDTSGLEIVQGENYNIAFVLDSSGSMGSDAVETAKNQLLEVFKTLQAAASGKHAGTVNIAVIDFDGSAVTSLAVNILDLNINALANNDNDAWKNILSGGYTDYKAAFTEAKNWFTSSDVANNTGHNVTYFITDGKHNGNDNPNHAFNLLNNVSEVEAIGLKNEVNESDLTRYDSDGNVRAKISVDNLASVILGSETLLSQGDDHTSGGLGNDIIFGDLAQFDGIDGQGFSALQKLVANETNQNAADITVSDIHSFITSHPEMFDTAHLNDGDDVLDGNQGDDILFGQGGDDELHGGSGDDLLLGGMGTDELIGGAGEDILIGGLGDDTLTGGSGKADSETDTFVWQQGDTGTDHITDFNINQDKLDLSDLLQGENAGNLENYLHFTVDNGSTTIEIDANNDGHVDQTIVLDGVDLSYLGTTDGQIINGLLGNDGNGALIVDNASSTESASSFAVPATHDDDGQIQHLIP